MGPVLVATILAEVRDVARFPSLKALVASAGLDPSVFQSGAFQGTRRHLSKRGSPYLRRALWEGKTSVASGGARVPVVQPAEDRA